MYLAKFQSSPQARGINKMAEVPPTFYSSHKKREKFRLNFIGSRNNFAKVRLLLFVSSSVGYFKSSARGESRYLKKGDETRAARNSSHRGI